MITLNRFKQLLTHSLIATSALTLVGCAQPLSTSKTSTYSNVDNFTTSFYQHTRPYTQANPNKTGFYPLGDGQAALLARLAVIEGAQKTIDVQYYIYRDDATSNLLTWYLYQAAERGVRVRLLLDDMQNRDDQALASLSAHPNVEVRLFNPFGNRSFKPLSFLTDFDRLNRRMHNKSIIADGVFAITGGRNIGDEYFSANDNVEFGDFDLLMIGKIIPQVSRQFDEYWNSKPATPIEALVSSAHKPTPEQLTQWKQAQLKYMSTDYARSLKNHPMVKQLINQTLPLFWTDAELLYDTPYKVANSKDDLLLHKLSEMIAKADHDFFLVSPYFVPTEEGAKELAQAAKNGKNITIVTNSLASNDVFAVHGWYAKYRKIMLEGGVKLYEVKVEPGQKTKHKWLSHSRTSLHAKTFIIDKSKIFVGSFNFDPRSAYLNTELGVIVDSPTFSGQVYNQISDSMLKEAYRLSLDENGDIVWNDDVTGKQYTSEPDSSIWLKMGAWAAGVLPIENQL
ncbi:cardiolipin synthetase [Photobacterium aquimaris]|uniref:Phospholipase D family protein n=1 Tax=Photobacterium aquimaris TaxID=512643 RepID=A0A2T3IQP5_9GAMM|nr:phospholipase D family protein [Photobacterium aquimaris]OBU17094.1 cardiolipin synthetase [Photobacterium aquimaris]OBU17557.1 cardiolipin synthetase [Photobacterium aquimaris]PSU30662.1 phospholipase D family protein [Photobacterium aquimaris]PSV98909.1 phospholipase D family protein [Photobacterium aquimaris]